MQKFEIPIKIIGLNDYITINRTNKYKASKMKNEIENNIIICIKAAKIKHIKRPVFICFTWYEKTRRRDKDNVRFAKKFILDALQKAQVLENDNNDFIVGFLDNFIYGNEQKVKVEIFDCDEIERW